MDNQKNKTKKTVTTGDIYAVNLPNGKFGAIRILDQTDNSYLLATTPYNGTEIPSIENDILEEILIQNRFFYDNNPALVWVDGKVPKDVIYIGNIPLTKKERKIKCNSFGEKWDNSDGIEAFLEWRWENDRENFEREIREEEERYIEEFHTIQKPKEMMKDELFWSIISLLNFNAECEEEIIEPAVNKLAKMSVRDIKQFEEALSYKLYLLDTKEHAKNIGEYSYDKERDYFSADLFLYFRCSVLARGKEFFESTLDNPKNMPKDDSFESLLSLASDAYIRRTGKEFEYITGCDYESFSNVEGWK
ncbi:DUF4240 domain-containing protein [Peribacillus sp. NJ11]|uniref:DUF4240 domain-containing protein n=1 Tax=Peribacillus sp. NJ11 TaxID=3055861 RepID=UPI0025A29371|nr:DUF4240 domain-containing protein [Peribacillus sp. NJ11]MDM5221094.1 DUF4240 domain-containing protein [Peribacillus sp. NJ11]